MKDLRSDLTRLTQALQAAGTPSPWAGYPLLETLSETLREQENAGAWDVRLALRDQEIVAALPSPEKDPRRAALYGLAVDIGTTKVAAYLVDLATGEVIGPSRRDEPSD